MESEPLPCKAQILIDKEIHQLRESIRLLHYKRNQYALITKLQPEILSRIFTYVEWAHQQEDYQSKRHYNFSFVSQDWREIAISTPEVWATLPKHPPEWCRTVLERSKASDLTIRVCLHYPHRANDLQEILAEHAARLFDLSISSFDSTMIHEVQLFLNALPTSAPRLRNLRLVFNVPLTLPMGSFSDTRLSNLVIQKCRIVWKSSLFTGLTDLTIINNPCSGPLVDFFDALTRMPGLRKLVLIESIPSGSPPPLIQPISLFSLEELYISGDMYDLEKVLKYLSVLVSTMVKIECTSWSRIGGDSRPFEQIMAAFTGSISHFFALMRSNAGNEVPFYETLSLYPGASHRMLIRTWGNNWIRSGAPFTETGDEKPHFTFLAPFENTLATRIAAALPLSHLKTLMLMLKSDCSSLIRTFGHLQRLETIIFNGSSEVIKALRCIKAPPNKPDYRDRLPFLGLENLLMRDVLFEEYRRVDHITVDSLMDCLMERSEYGAPIQKLFIYHSWEIYPRDIEMLEEIVVDVAWDGYEEEYAPVDGGSDYLSSNTSD
ncbi:hypothetical protein CPB83DRAFT_795637 [Crepidotus variabilis]|uniref:F-box domain-containing protein n=1 Tax=Crepidotus variabilis TaxID=179855 RepID=A0A9P6EB76_9AGAR|nr:hypothetical protein CPB83DRAFT_795637 [Crepidotus variabilis]